MKIGDKIRFLNEVGDGVVTKMIDAKTVLVEDADGFDIPMLISECVVIETNDYNIPIKPETKPTQEPEPQITFKPRALERDGGDVLNMYIAFVPCNVDDFTNTSFDFYIINDSNYVLNFALFNQQGTAQVLRCADIVQPNTKLHLETIDRFFVNNLDQLSVQAFFYKNDKKFHIKQPVATAIKLDLTKFYKLKSFKENEFFEEVAWVVPFVKDDVVVSPTKLDILISNAKGPTVQPTRQSTMVQTNDNSIIEIDLHADAILETTNGMSAKDILDYQIEYFHQEMKSYIKRKGTTLVFIHGKGDGVLRQAVERELRYFYKNCTFQDASFMEYGYGATMVKVEK